MEAPGQEAHRGGMAVVQAFDEGLALSREQASLPKAEASSQQASRPGLPLRSRTFCVSGPSIRGSQRWGRRSMPLNCRGISQSGPGVRVALT